MDELAAAYRAVLGPWLDQARDQGQLPRASWQAGQQHLAALAELLDPSADEDR